MAFCTQCGVALDEGARFCTSCGAQGEQPASPAAQPASPTPAASPAPAAPAGTKFPLGKFVLVFIGVVMLITGGVAYAAYKSPLGQAIVHMFRHEAPPAEAETNVQRAGMGTPEVQGDLPAEDSNHTQSPSPKPDPAMMKAIEDSNLAPEMKKSVLAFVNGDKPTLEKLRNWSPPELCKMDNGVVIKNYPGAKGFEGRDEYKGVETDQPTSVMTPADAATVTSWLVANNSSCLTGYERRYGKYFISKKDECSKDESVGIFVAPVKEGSIIVAQCPRQAP